MTVEDRALEYRRVRAPARDRSIVVKPPLAEVDQLLAANRLIRAAYDYDLHGLSLGTLSQQARREFVQAAYDYTSAYREVPTGFSNDAILLAGHQPELFHPGVWCKNFALGQLAAERGATAVNLLVDSDTMKRASLRVPTGDIANPQVREVAFDQPTIEIPYEERTIVDRSLFQSFGYRASQQLASLVPRPLIDDFWPRVLQRADASANIGACFAQARHQLEGQWGLVTLELPQSRVCSLPSFLWFTAHLLCHLPRLHGIYNRGVAEYRRVNRIRSLNHPVPNLASDDGWIEAPYWVWSSDSPRRRRLFARNRDGALELTDRQGWQITLPACRSDLSGPVSALARLPAAGIKLRSRALITTLFARLLVGDLFIHGIGGAKYDELTDLIIRHFFAAEPPRYLMLSGTLLLPIEHPRTSEDDVRAVNQRLRELTFHPEVHLDMRHSSETERAAAERWVKEKRRWVTTPQTVENARQRCAAIRQANEALQPFVAGQRAMLLAERYRLTAALRANAILESREYSFCLYPEATLRPFLLGLKGQLQTS